MKDLVELLVEAHQEVPSWLESMGYEVRHTGGARSGRGGNKRLVDLYVCFGCVLLLWFTYVVVKL